MLCSTIHSTYLSQPHHGHIWLTYLLTYFIAFLGNFLVIPYILETGEVRKHRISDVCPRHWTHNVLGFYAVDPGIRNLLYSQPKRLIQRCKIFISLSPVDIDDFSDFDDFGEFDDLDELDDFDDSNRNGCFE